MTKEFVQFLRVARGSLYELETHITVTQRLGYLKPTTAGELLSEAETVGRMLLSLIRALQRRQ